MKRAVLLTKFGDGVARPVEWKAIEPSGFKFSFDVVKRIRSDNGLVADTDAGSFRVGTDGKTMLGVPRRAWQERRAAARFHLDTRRWEWIVQDKTIQELLYLSGVGAVVTLPGGKFPWDFVTDIRPGSESAFIYTLAAPYEWRPDEGNILLVTSTGEIRPRGSGPISFPSNVQAVREWGDPVQAAKDRSGTWLLFSRRLIRIE
jgi:hypothetical protein